MQIATFYEKVDAFERQLLQDAIDAARGDRARAAQRLGLHLDTFELKATRWGIVFSRPEPPRGQW